jgi:hypothetical protein
MRAVYMFLICLLSLSMAAVQTDATLKVGTKTYAASELLKRPKIESITVNHDPAYGGREMHYQAIRAAALFAATNLRGHEVMQVRCLDGFVASTSKKRISPVPLYPQSEVHPILGRQPNARLRTRNVPGRRYCRRSGLPEGNGV